MDTDKYEPYTDIDAFISWLATMPADGTFDFTNARECALAQFAGSLGYEYSNHSSTYVYGGYDFSKFIDITNMIDLAQDKRTGEFSERKYNDKSVQEYTFGEALKRARLWKEKGCPAMKKEEDDV